VASFLKLGVVACNLAAQGADVFRVETKVLEGKDDCLGELQSRCPRIFMLTFREGGRRTMEVGWTEANQIAISSCTMPWGVRRVLLEVDSRIHWMQSACSQSVSRGRVEGNRGVALYMFWDCVPLVGELPLLAPLLSDWE
jgi:hypothetical protein